MQTLHIKRHKRMGRKMKWGAHLRSTVVAVGNYAAACKLFGKGAEAESDSCQLQPQYLLVASAPKMLHETRL